MQERLHEIDILRPLTIVLLVVMHAFTMYAGNWDYPEGIHDVRAYFWVQKISFSCMLEMFVFISGYILGYQVYSRHKHYTFGSILVNKLRRLMLPSVLFSLLYIVCFTSYIPDHAWTRITYQALAGMAHLWFLPMLFWCFLISHVLLQWNINDLAKLGLLLVLSLFSHLPLPLQLNMSCYYMFFFYLGIVMYRHRGSLKQYAEKNIIGIAVSLIGYIAIVILFTRTIESLSLVQPSDRFEKLLLLAQINACKIVYATAGVMLLYMLAIYYTSRASVNKYIVSFNYYCFSIYIFHQFIIEALYYHTSIPQILGTYWTPWAGTIIGLLVSYALAHLVLLTKTGKYLLG